MFFFSEMKLQTMRYEVIMNGGGGGSMMMSEVDIFCIVELYGYPTFLEMSCLYKNNQIFASLTLGSEHLLKAVTNVTWHNTEPRKLS